MCFFTEIKIRNLFLPSVGDLWGGNGLVGIRSVNRNNIGCFGRDLYRKRWELLKDPRNSTRQNADLELSY